MIFKGVGDGKPYPAHDLEDWSHLPPRMIRLDELVTTRAELDLHVLLSPDSTFYGDIFCHVVKWDDQLYLEDGLHRALRAALQGRPVVHGRVLDLDAGAGR
ncbi:type II toxin-antitoxin system VapB family antitoxin [Ornithinimicrobium cerasi]|uniref:Transcription regulator of the Arc/MetJ class n=1 Tax=Ornithinimicrobium cerasi TaxID=2248773 RepID=A0A285VT52_9MICO|nr:type II toxin-antitoxin system VapB family antitoxin [Ornithinimicrobium cerasi]SOC57264.1 Transcription regulator of the Arc/MetJ class [Ornithinimicrobium cerasi]